VKKRTKKRHSFELKREVVLAYLAGEGTSLELAARYQLSSRGLLKRWVQTYRAEGEEGLRRKLGRPAGQVTQSAPKPVTEIQRLRAENERLRAEVAYLGKLKALRDHKRQ